MPVAKVVLILLTQGYGHGLGFALSWKLTLLQQEVFAEIASIVAQAEGGATAFHERAQRSCKRLAGSALRWENDHE